MVSYFISMFGSSSLEHFDNKNNIYCNAPYTSIMIFSNKVTISLGGILSNYTNSHLIMFNALTCLIKIAIDYKKYVTRCNF